jgi:uroporphyrin-III C-methyltransferase
MVLCTGVGRKGKAVQLPGYVRGRTLVVLMGVARIRQVIDVLTRQDSAGRDGAAYPSNLPIAIIERASSHDQRMVASTLAGIEDALVAAGDQRPPGMMIIGWAVLALEGEGEVTVLDDEEDLEQQEQQQRDQDRVDRWLAGKKYLLKDGLGDEWARFITPEIQAQVEQAETIDTYQEYNRG